MNRNTKNIIINYSYDKELLQLHIIKHACAKPANNEGDPPFGMQYSGGFF